jgi:undecaprenyl-diphosphatase
MAIASEFQALVLGIVQGLTEFLPVSSSAHLTIIPWLLRWEDPGLSFDVALHLGTLLALLAFYWRDWLEILSSAITGQGEGRRSVLLLIIASLPGAIFGLLFEKQAETVFRSPLLIAGAMATLGLILWFADSSRAQERRIGEISPLIAAAIGLSQAFALIPGVSRSGVTITVGRLFGLYRQDAANFSFLMATPIIAGAGLLKTREFFRSGFSAPLLLGFLASAVFGWLAIGALLRLLRSRSYEAFAWYRVIFGILVAIIYFWRG